MSTSAAAPSAPRTAAEISQSCQLEDEARKLLRTDMLPRQYVEQLIGAGCLHDAVKFLAQALPKREAVWWASQCAKSVAGSNPPPPTVAAIQAAEAWVTEPTEEHRRAAMQASEAAQLSTPAGCAALAAFLSGGSLAPPDVPVVPPAEHLTGHAAGGAVMLAAAVSEPEKAPDKLRAFLAQGLHVAKVRKVW